MATSDVNGVTFHTVTMGSGPPVAMIHGLFFGNLAAWYFHAAPALAREHEVFLYDMRGHGKSSRTASGYDLTTMTADLRGLIQRYEDTPIDLVGHSYGSLVALRYALDHPERVRRLVLIEPPLPPHKLAESEDLLPFTRARMKDVFQGDELRSRLAARDDADRILDALPKNVQDSLLHGRRGIRRIARNLKHLIGESSLLADLRAEVDIPDDELRTIHCPTLCIVGSESKLRSVGDRLVATMPHTSLLELEGGHYIVNTRSRELSVALEEFLGV
jgi:pimeloyl-ACP methyl ester carboxylesterase